MRKNLKNKDRKGVPVVIHQYQNNGYNIVLDVNSGCVHVVDEPGYDVIACLEPYERESDSADAERRKYMEPAER